MGRASTKSNKNRYQLVREELGLSREKASELLEAVTPERIEKIESGKSLPHPDEVLTMAARYRRPSLCNYYCSNQCPIGQAYVPEIEMKELSAIVLEMLASLENEELKNEAIGRMGDLNKAIAGVEDLNENYQIGAAYFLKLKTLSFDQLWTDYLQPLLQEYVRGMYDEERLMDRFAKAYGYQRPVRGDTNEAAEDPG